MAVLSLPADGAGAAAPFRETLPLNPGDLNGGKLQAALDLARDAGVTQIQTFGTWWWLTRKGGPRSYEWSDLDRLIRAARSRGMRVVLQLNGTPDWVHPKLAATVPDAMERVWYPPVRDKELDHWADFVTDIVTRYRGDVAQYEIWNEPNHPPFWRPAPNVTEYARLLRRAYEAAREADPRATIVFGGLAQNSIGYLEAFYDAVDRIWPARGRSSDYFFDILGSHPYSGDRSPRVLDPRYSHSDAYGEVDENFLGFRRLRAVVQRRDASSKPIYIGEFGYPTGMISDETRAQYLADAYQLAAGEGYVTGLSWYSFVPDSTNTGGWPIVDPNLTPSLTFQALRAVDTGR